VIKKAILAATLLFVLAAANAGALQVQIIVGLSAFFRSVEVSLLTPPGAMGGYQQEIGLRLVTIGDLFTYLDLVLRSWWSFPGSRSDFLRYRFRCGVEYSPTLYCQVIDGCGGWLSAVKLGFCSSFRLNDPSAVNTTDLFLSILGYLEVLSCRPLDLAAPELWVIAGVAFRSQDL